MLTSILILRRIKIELDRMHMLLMMCYDVLQQQVGRSYSHYAVFPVYNYLKRCWRWLTLYFLIRL